MYIGSFPGWKSVKVYFLACRYSTMQSRLYRVLIEAKAAPRVFSIFFNIQRYILKQRKKITRAFTSK